MRPLPGAKPKRGSHVIARGSPTILAVLAWLVVCAAAFAGQSAPAGAPPQTQPNSATDDYRLERGDEIGIRVGWAATAVGTVVSFIVAYASIAWLLRYVARHSIVTFVWYRVALGGVLAVALGAGWLSAT